MNEDRLQFLIAEELRKRKILFFHVPNGGYRNTREACKLVAMGVLSGVSDLVLLFDNAKTVFIELKINKNKRSEKQEKFHEQISKMGFQSHLIQADSYDSGLLQLREILAQNEQ